MRCELLPQFPPHSELNLHNFVTYGGVLQAWGFINSLKIDEKNIVLENYSIWKHAQCNAKTEKSKKEDQYVVIAYKVRYTPTLHIPFQLKTKCEYSLFCGFFKVEIMSRCNDIRL